MYNEYFLRTDCYEFNVFFFFFAEAMNLIKEKEFLVSVHL